MLIAPTTCPVKSNLLIQKSEIAIALKIQC